MRWSLASEPLKLSFAPVMIRNCNALIWLICLLAWTVAVPAAEDDTSFAGTYRDEQVVIHLSRVDGGTDYSGTIEVDGQKYPLKGQQQDQRLKGTFDSDGDEFAFSASVVGRMLVFTTDGTTYRLKKQSTNPLARPATKPNPLGQSRTNASPAAIAVMPAPVGKSNALRLRRYSIMDDPAMIGGEASSLLVPADWQADGGVAWRMHPSLPIYTVVRVANSNRTEVLEAFPSIPFVWVEGGIPMFPKGANYMGNEVGPPIEDPVGYVQQVVLPRFRPNLKTPMVVSTEELPLVAKAIYDTTPESAAQQKFRAARVRLEYAENGRTMQEDIYCVMAVASVASTRTTFWGADRSYSFKAEKGRLEARSKLFQAMANSFRSNLQWVNRYIQVLQLMSQTTFEPNRSPAELARFVPRTTEEISDLRRQIFERQQANLDRVNASFSPYVRGLEEYRDPFASRTVTLPGGYVAVWANAAGEYLLSDDPNLNPNAAGRHDWQKVEKDH
jgi:hypothetical protein